MNEKTRQITILGAGPGGIATAALLAMRGFAVSLFNRSKERLIPFITTGGIEFEGDFGEGFVALNYIGTDIARAINGSDVLICFTPANGQVYMAEQAAPYLSPGMTFLLASGSAGTLEVARVFRECGVDYLNDVVIGETLTLPQSARMVGPGKVRIKLPWKPRTAAFPARNNNRLYEALEGIITFLPTSNVLDTGLNNVNFIIHPGPMVLNYAAVERLEGRLSIMNEGMTPGVLRCMDALDVEKMALCEALDLAPIAIDDIYIEMGSSPGVYREKGEPFELRDRIWDRYITEDVPYGTVLFSSLGRLIGVPTPISDGINAILSVVEQTDFYQIGRTVEKIGLAGLSIAEIQDYVQEGG